MYYSKFDLLCIYEFPNVSEIDLFFIQPLFNIFSEMAFNPCIRRE